MKKMFKKLIFLALFISFSLNIKAMNQNNVDIPNETYFAGQEFDGKWTSVNSGDDLPNFLNIKIEKRKDNDADLADNGWISLEEYQENNVLFDCLESIEKKEETTKKSKIYNIKYFLLNGANPNAISNTSPKRTPLTYAIDLIEPKIVKLLLNYGANPLLKQKNMKESALEKVIKLISEIKNKKEKRKLKKILSYILKN